MLLVYGLVGFVWLLDAASARSCFCDPWPYTGPSYAVLGLLMVGWPIWRFLEPRPMRELRDLACLAGFFGAWVTIVSVGDQVTLEDYEFAVHAYGVVALALYAEIARGVLDRWRHRSEHVPEMRARMRRSAS